MSDKAESFWRGQEALGLLWLLGLGAYSTALGGRFQFDDYLLIVNNPELASLAASWGSLGEGLRPLTKLTLMANVWLHGLRSLGFHLVNLAIHLGATVLVYRILERIPGGSLRLTWFGTAVFLLHPAQTEAVTYISGRSSSLMAACLLAAHWLAVRAEGMTGAWRWRLASLGAFLAGVLAKEVGLIYPLLYLIWLRVLEQRPWRETFRRVVPYAAVAAALFVALLVHPSYHNLIAEAAERQTLKVALLSEARAVVTLLGIVVFPWRVNIDHALPLAAGVGEVGLDIVVLSALLVLAAWSRRRWPGVAGGLLWGLAALVPTNSVLVRQDLISDRLLYLPMVGFSLALASLLEAAVAAGEQRCKRAALVGTIVVAAVTLGLGGMTGRRNLLYHSEVTLWTDSVRKTPHNARAHHNLGYAYELEGKLPAAVREYRAALALRPSHPRYQQSLAIALSKLEVIKRRGTGQP